MVSRLPLDARVGAAGRAVAEIVHEPPKISLEINQNPLYARLTA